MLNLFGLAQDGKTDARGLPNPLQLALPMREFRDVIRFTRPPPVLQAIVFGLLAPFARLLRYRASYPDYLSLARRRECRSSRRAVSTHGRCP
jgi:hypothetical protein